MLDVTDVTNFNRSDKELEEFLLFSCAVAGKTAKQISIALDRFLDDSQNPFKHIICLSKNNNLYKRIVDSRLGNHNKLNNLFYELANSGINLRTCWVDDLEAFKGIGPKTSRYFLLHTRRPETHIFPIAAIDTHIQKWLKSLGYQCKSYHEYEEAMFKEASQRGVTVADLDLSVWNMMSSRSGTGECLVG